MIRGFDSQIVPILWYYPDGVQCPIEHQVESVRDVDGDIVGLRCEVTGRSLHSIVHEIARLRSLVPTHVYIAESIFEGCNPWDSRTRYGIGLSLDDALQTLSSFADGNEGLVATPGDDPDDTDYWNGGDPIRWMVHRPDEDANWGGHLWVFKEPIVSPGGE